MVQIRDRLLAAFDAAPSGAGPPRKTCSAAGRLGRGDRFRGPLVAGGPQLDRAGTGALFAPMTLRTIEALSRAAAITDKNFFPHLTVDT